MLEATALARAVLGEVAEHLRRFAEHGEGHQIDLRSLPMHASDRTALADALGRGEVQATVSVAGRSEAYETRYAGVWWVSHEGRNGDVLAEFIEITHVPTLLCSVHDDVRDAAVRLTRALNPPDPHGSPRA